MSMSKLQKPFSDYIAKSEAWDAAHPDYHDSRDIIKRIQELEDDEALNPNMHTEEDAEELKELHELADQAQQYTSEWKDGTTLIRASYFERYCQEMLEDIGDIPRDLPGYIVIDWEATARNIGQDYMTIDFDSSTYYIRMS